MGVYRQTRTNCQAITLNRSKQNVFFRQITKNRKETPLIAAYLHFGEFPFGSAIGDIDVCKTLQG